MSKASNQPATKSEINTSVKTGETGIKVFAKSGSPKTLKEHIQLFLNLFLNFFS